MSEGFTVGDKGTSLEGTCRDGKTPVDLTGRTVQLRYGPTGDPARTGEATVTDPTGGSWEYVWADGELDTDGLWSVTATVLNGTTVEQTFGPATFYVAAQR